MFRSIGVHGAERRAWPLLAMLAALLALLVASPGRAAERVALVIGNAAYPDAPLRNAVNDARAMSRTLGELGFEVISLENAGKQRMEQAIVRFVGRLDGNTSGVFYYAGHGVQVSGRNYLIPVDAKIGSEREIRIETVGLHVVLDEMGYAGNRINIVILDACRNNPFERRLRGATRGLAAIDAARGTLIAYATAPGSVALDGDGENGIYTEELLAALRAPGLEVEEVFKQVRVGVARRTNQQQIPWESSSLTGRFVFNAKATPATAQGATGRQAEVVYWQSASASGSADAYRAYLRRFPQGLFVDLARIRLAELEQPAAGAPITDVDASMSQGPLVAKVERDPQGTPAPRSTLEETKRALVIGVIEPNGTVWGACTGQLDKDSMARDVSRHVQSADGFTFLNLWYRGVDTSALWAMSGIHLKPSDREVFAYARKSSLNGVLVLRYEASGSYCEQVRIEVSLYDAARERIYRGRGNETDIGRMTDDLVAEFARARAGAQ